MTDGFLEDDMGEDTVACIVLYVIISIMSGPLVSVFLTPIYCVVRSIVYVPAIQDKLVEEAKRKGHVVQAILIKTKEYDYKIEDKSGTEWVEKTKGKYRYQVNGRNYTCTFEVERLSADFSKEITLYWLKKPRRATSYGNLGYYELPHPFLSWLLISVLSTVAIFVISMITGWAE